MGCCCCGGDGEEDNQADDEHYKRNPGPKEDRGCTDTPCLLLYVLFLAALTVLWLELEAISNVHQLTNGQDHYGQFCGIDIVDKPMLYFPRLQEDLVADFTLTNVYGVCVKKCPPPRVTIEDYGERADKNRWFVTYPSISVVGRCIPYEDLADIQNSGTRFCAYPTCDPGKRVCGLKSDETSQYWVLSEPDEYLVAGWMRENGTDQSQVDVLRNKVRTYMKEGAAGECEAELVRETRLRNPVLKDEAAFKLLTSYTGLVTRQVRAVYENITAVLVLGLLGSLLAAMVVIVCFSCCVRVVINVLIILLFISLTAADYVLFVHAGIFTGNTGKKLLQQIGGEEFANETTAQLLEERIGFADAAEMASIYTILAYGLLACIVLLVCIFGAIQRNLKMLYALLDETASVVLTMPSLLLAPFFAFMSMSLCSIAMTWMGMFVATLDYQKTVALAAEFGLESHLKTAEDLPPLQKIATFALIFGWLWIYYMHVATFIAVCAGCVSKWYFFRDDPLNQSGTGRGSEGYFFGRPILLSFQRIVRYHLGSLALGSLIMALATMPRIILEYVAEQSKDTDSEIVKCAISCVRWVLYCVQKCLEFLTEYAYIYVAVTGDRFCKSARRSFVLFAEYPLQVTLDTLASQLLTYAACVTVPTIMGLMAYMVSSGEAALAITAVVVVLSYFTTRLTVRVYDVCCTALFVCVCRDSKYHNCKYMPAGLKKAFQMVRDSDDVELSSREEAGQSPDGAPPNWG